MVRLRGRQGLVIDTSNTFAGDNPPGKDADIVSASLRAYHRALWSKPLPDGTVFTLDGGTARTYLHHASSRGEFVLTSDFMMGSFGKAAGGIVGGCSPDVRRAYNAVAPTIGGRIIRPGRQIGGEQTINQRRGTHPRIRDRFDLTLECVRRFYRGVDSPLTPTLAMYRSSFDLFRDFRGYTEFFLLQDFVGPGGTVTMQHTFENFTTPAILVTTADYERYLIRCTRLLRARNARIRRWCRDRAPR